MSSLIKALKARFGDKNVYPFPKVREDDIDMLSIEFEFNTIITVLMTNGISNYSMQIPKGREGNVFNELYFCLPSYWELHDKSNSNMQWPVETLQKLAKNLLNKQTWYAEGHTVSNGIPPHPISEAMKEMRFLFIDPIAMEDYLTPLTLDDKTIHFLSVVPIFENEYHYRINKGHAKFMKKFKARGHNEILDDFREDALKRNWKMF